MDLAINIFLLNYYIYEINRKGFNTLIIMFAIVKTALAYFLIVKIRKYIPRNAKCGIQIFGHDAIFIPLFPYKELLSSAISRCGMVVDSDTLCYKL